MLVSPACCLRFHQQGQVEEVSPTRPHFGVVVWCPAASCRGCMRHSPAHRALWSGHGLYQLRSLVCFRLILSYQVTYGSGLAGVDLS
jgi:hypothetical protein